MAILFVSGRPKPPIIAQDLGRRPSGGWQVIHGDECAEWRRAGKGSRFSSSPMAILFVSGRPKPPIIAQDLGRRPDGGGQGIHGDECGGWAPARNWRVSVRP